MAEGASYPVRLVNADDKTSFGTTLVFADSSNQPDPAQVYVQTTDPGAVGAGALWLNTTTISLTTGRPLSVRSAANDAWVPLGLAVYDSGGFLRAQVTLNVNGGVGIESRDGAAAAKSFLILKNTVAKLRAATSMSLTTLAGDINLTPVGGNVLVPIATAIGAAARISQVSPLFAITSGALPTQQLVTATGAQISTTGDVEVHTPVTFNPGVATTATCLVELSPDNVTYSALTTWTEPVGVAFAGTIHDVSVRVPAGWYLRLTVNAQAVLGLSTYY